MNQINKDIEEFVERSQTILSLMINSEGNDSFMEQATKMLELAVDQFKKSVALETQQTFNDGYNLGKLEGSYRISTYPCNAGAVTTSASSYPSNIIPDKAVPVRAVYCTDKTFANK
jgi:hypothetical protein